MKSGRNKLYIYLCIALFSGYTWLVYQVITGNSEKNDSAGVCLFHNVTGIPCPSCGSTRSVTAILHGDIIGSLKINPIGFIITAVMVFSPVWLLSDLLSRKSTLYDFFLRAEIFLGRKWVAIPAALLVIVNWIWNISKGL